MDKITILIIIVSWIVAGIISEFYWTYSAVYLDKKSKEVDVNLVRLLILGPASWITTYFFIRRAMAWERRNNGN